MLCPSSCTWFSFPTPQASDELEAVQLVTAKARVKAFCFAPPAARLPAGVRCRLALSLGNNSIEVRRGVTRGTRGSRVRCQGFTETRVGL